MRVDEQNSFDSLLQRYRSALLALDTLGIKTCAPSRLRRYEHLIQAMLDDPRPTVEEDLVFAVGFALREIDEIIEIVEHLPADIDSTTNLLLSLVRGGTDSPDDEATAAAREAQYELYLGAVFRRAGLKARHGKPDLTVLIDGAELLIEAKRPGSAARVDDRIRSAVHQLRNAPAPGVIALSVDQVIRPRNTILSAPAFDLIAPEVARLVAEFVKANSGVWRNRLAGEPVDAIVVTARVPARLESSGYLVLGTNLHLEPISQVSPTPAAALKPP